MREGVCVCDGREYEGMGVRVHESITSCVNFVSA